MVEEKQNQDEETARSSKRVTKSTSKKEEGPPPKLTSEVNMEDAPKDKKQGKSRGPSYKLKFDIELATDLKKVFKERILNSKVEMTLGDNLGIAKLLPDLSKPFEVHCDANGDCLGAVLLQEGHAIAYESRRLHSDEQSLGIYEKELLAVMHALDTWKHYLLGTPFIIRTDHQSLKCFMTQTKIFDKQLRWANFLSRFHFHIPHISGKHNQVVDALSRRARCNAVSVASHSDLTSMVDEYATNPNFCDVMSAITLGKTQEPYVVQDGYLLYGSRLCVTKSLREKVMYESHTPPYAGHRGIQSTMNAIVSFFFGLQ
ncbi:hypothetical protein L7F22_022122 [Adiantum nelumboides]|nr:hypothetical protein [Adiantum nelumboides]